MSKSLNTQPEVPGPFGTQGQCPLGVHLILPEKEGFSSASLYPFTLTQSPFAIILVRQNFHNIKGSQTYKSLNIYICVYWESSLDQDIKHRQHLSRLFCNPPN